jgi:hypothetical protein
LLLKTWMIPSLILKFPNGDYCWPAQSTMATASAGTLAFQAATGAAAPRRRVARIGAGTGSAIVTPLARIRA